MATKIPQITENLMNMMRIEKHRELVELEGYTLDIQPYMFPPKSPYSYSTRVLIENMNLTNQRVLEIGTGCGILSIAASKQGARVDGVDIIPECVQFSLDNAIRNNTFQTTRFYYSNMFSNIDPTTRYDTILCNLPILDDNLPEPDPRWYSLFDPNFKFHRELFQKGKNHAPRIMMAHADLKTKNDFKLLESLAREYGWNVEKTNDKEYAGKTWRAYSFKLN